MAWISKYWWIFFLIAFLAAIAILTHKSPDIGDEYIDKIPIGSNVSDLDQYLDKNLKPGFVFQWDSVSDESDSADFIVNNEFGSFTSRNVGKYNVWIASSDNLDDFSGIVGFFFDGYWGLAGIDLVYIKGKLQEKSWGEYYD